MLIGILILTSMKIKRRATNRCKKTVVYLKLNQQCSFDKCIHGIWRFAGKLIRRGARFTPAVSTEAMVSIFLARCTYRIERGLALCPLQCGVRAFQIVFNKPNNGYAHDGNDRIGTATRKGCRHAARTEAAARCALKRHSGSAAGRHASVQQRDWPPVSDVTF